MKKPSYITELDYKMLKQKYKFLFFLKPYFKKQYPVQYLIGNVDFYGYKIKVNKNVLIPRFETEGLVEHTKELILKHGLETKTAIDLCTGSGCIAIALKKMIPTLEIDLLDKSKEAIEVASENASMNEVDCHFINADLFKYQFTKKYSIVISNPPYLTENDLVDEKIKYEPKEALYALDDGLAFYNYILKNIKDNLEDKYILAFEIGESQGKYLKKYAESLYPNALVYVKKDLSDKDRYLFVLNV